GNPTLTFEPILSDSSPSLTPFKESDFILEEIEAFLTDESSLLEIDPADCDPDGDICLIEKLKRPLSPVPMEHLLIAECPLAFALLLGYFKDTMLQRCEDTNLVLNWEKCHFMVKEGIVLGHKIFNNRLDVDRAKVDVLAKLPHPMTVKGVRIFLGHVEFYQRFIHDFSKIARPMTHLLEKDTPKRPLSPVPMEHLLIAECPLAFALLLGYFKDTMLQRCEDTNLVLNWEKCHFMVKEGIVLGHKIFNNRLDVDRAKVDVLAKLPHPTTVKGVRIFLGHVEFYQRFIHDFSKIARPMTHLLEKDTPFVFSKDCIDAFETLKKKLTEALILVVPDWNLPFELMCDASDFVIGEVLGQRKMKHF
nr:reverse transcriptase domain-containing protein [Tanacetum cinerariifolium]